MNMAVSPEVPSRVRQLADELAHAQPMRRGSLSDRTIRCGKAGCACANNPKARHGPYHSLTQAVEGKTRSRFLSEEQAAVARQQIAIIPDGLECCLGRRMGLVRGDRRRVEPRFFVYQYVSAPYREFLSSRTVRGATVDRIALKEFPSFPIILPPLDQQKAIVKMLDALKAETQRSEE